MEVLAALAQRPGEVVEREELLRRVWGSRAAVADEPLTRCIAELRRVLGDSRQTPIFIQTIPKRGYRLICPVTPLAPTAAAALMPAPERSDGARARCRGAQRSAGRVRDARGRGRIRLWSAPAWSRCWHSPASRCGR